MKDYGGPSLDVWREYFDYDEETGHFTVRKWKSGSYRQVGERAESTDVRGYLVLFFCSKTYYAQMVAWFFIHGVWPTSIVDHKDLNKSHNSKRNLRMASPSQDGANRTLQANNTSGFKGVSWDKSKSLWTASIKVDQCQRHLGRYPSAEEAAKAYAKAANNLFGEFARLE